MSDDTKGEPNPGSPSAIEAGCKCAVIDNGHGRGYMGQPDVFVITAGCPVHGPGVDGGFLSELSPTPSKEPT